MSSVFAREEYHSAIRSLGSAQTRLQGLSQPLFSSTPAVSSGSKSALVPEEEYVADDWLDDDLEEIQPKKKRRLRAEQNGSRGEDGASSSAARSQNWHSNLDAACRGAGLSLTLPLEKTSLFILAPFWSHSSVSGAAIPPASSRSHSLKKNGSLKPHQVKMTQMPGMVRLGRREISRSNSPTVTDDDDDTRPQTPPPTQIHTQVRKEKNISGGVKR